MCQETKVFGVYIGLGIGIVKTLCAIATVRRVIQLGVTFGGIVKMDQEIIPTVAFLVLQSTQY
eukprot:scaffold26331_cov19-Cyclotella_meneghiniana.AAC.1